MKTPDPGRRLGVRSQGDGPGHLGQRLGQRVDRVGELLALGLGDRVVGDEAVLALLYLSSSACRSVERGLDLLATARGP